VNITATPKAMLDRNRELLIVWSDSSPVSLNAQSAASKASEETRSADQPAENGLTHKTPESPRTGVAPDSQPAGGGSARKKAPSTAGTDRNAQPAGNGSARKAPAEAQTGTDNDE
jgi:rod shape-determining protein MreC